MSEQKNRVDAFNEKQKESYEKCLNSVNGLSVKDAETILYELLVAIKISSVITVE